MAGRRDTRDRSEQPGSSRSWPPAPGRLAMDGARAAGELSAMGATLPFLRRAARGDGHPVLVMPGLGAGDLSTRPLRWYLRDRGYVVHGWGLGTNEGPSARMLDGVGERLTALLERHGQPLSLIGWSMGGIFARELARAAPAAARQVVTLGSPFRLAGGGRSGLRYRHLAAWRSPEAAAAAEMPGGGGRPIAAPSTSIYTKADGVVPWESCLETPGERRQNVEVRGSHIGLGHNPAVLWAVADRLVQAKGTWAPFVATRGWRRLGGVGADPD